MLPRPKGLSSLTARQVSLGLGALFFLTAFSNSKAVCQELDRTLGSLTGCSDSDEVRILSNGRANLSTYHFIGELKESETLHWVKQHFSKKHIQSF